MTCARRAARGGISPARYREPKTASAAALEQRLQQQGVFLRVVLEIGVLNEAEVALGMLDGGADSGAFALVYLVAEQADAGVAGGDFAEDVPGAVTAAIVDDDEFPLHALG